MGSWPSTSPSIDVRCVAVVVGPVLVAALVPVEPEPDDPHAAATSAQQARRTAAAVSRRDVRRARLVAVPLVVQTR
ncbi:MAG TPA: hypothetical protein VJU60_06095 [Thermoleophilaceae bacterium]|nr:hypothetical protein [Thermoleophilaceae bacterium]